MEMQCVPTNGKGHIGVLLSLRQALEQSVGQLLCSSTGWGWSQSKLGGEITQVTCSRPMARAPAEKCQQKDEEKERWCKNGGKGESKGKAKRDGTMHGGRSAGLLPDMPTAPGRDSMDSTHHAFSTATLHLLPRLPRRVHKWDPCWQLWRKRVQICRQMSRQRCKSSTRTMERSWRNNCMPQCPI